MLYDTVLYNYVVVLANEGQSMAPEYNYSCIGFRYCQCLRVQKITTYSSESN